MQDDLIGYLVDALEPVEREEIERRLAADPGLQSHLAGLRRGLRPLAAGPADVDPPAGLATRTCEFVWRHRVALPIRPMPPAHDQRPAPPARRWTLADMIVAAGVAVAASAIILPAVNHSRAMARLTACSDNLRQLGLSLAQYGTLHRDALPDVPVEGNQAFAGVYAAKLRDAGLLGDPSRIICPGSPLAENPAKLPSPSLAELNAAQGQALAQLQAQMGGSYGYNLGYAAGNRLLPPKNLQRSNFAIMADAPRSVGGRFSVNHGAPGQNVLFEDGHVGFLNSSRTVGRDDIFVNDRGQVGLGLHRSDAVIAPSGARPVFPSAVGSQLVAPVSSPSP